MGSLALLAVLVLGLRPREIWDKRRTASLHGHPGCNVAWDFVLERMNREYCQTLKTNITDKRILQVGHELNGTRNIRRSIFEVFGINDDFSQFDGIKDADVQKMVDGMKAKLQLQGDQGEADRNRLMQVSTNCFKACLGRTPWQEIDAKVQKESTEDYVTRNLREAPYNNMS